MSCPNITTTRLILRGPTEADLNDWVMTIWADPEVMRFMPRSTDPPEVRAKGALAFFHRVREEQKVGAWVITSKVDGRFMGHTILAHRDKFGEVELGYALGRAFWGQGFATEVARAVAHYGFEQVGLPRMFGVVFPENEPSWRILRALGFAYEKDVVHYDLPLAYYGLDREKFTPNTRSRSG